MRRLGALWVVGLIGTVVLTLLAAASCGDGDGAAPTATPTESHADTATPATSPSPTSTATVGTTAGKIGAPEVTNAYARPARGSGSVYFTVKNTGDTDDALTSVSTEAAGEAGLHRSVTEGVTVKMQAVERIEIPARGETILEPGGYHVMLMDLKAPLEEGDTIELVLTFEKAGTVTIRASVRPYAESDDGMDDGMDDGNGGQ